MSLFAQFPTIRKAWDSVGNPAFVDDIVAANELALAGLSAMLNLPNPGFAIISGFDYSGGFYLPGVFWFNGQFYSTSVTISENSYLLPSAIDTLPEQFEDIVSRNCYTILNAVPVGSPIGATQIFSGDMNFWRLGVSNIKEDLRVATATISLLRNAAFRDVGMTPGTVAAGDDSRFGYTKAEADNLFATKALTLLRGNPGGNNNGFVPVNDQDPATKKYVDDNSAKILVRSSAPVAVGDIGSAGQQKTVALGRTLSSTNYMPFVTFYSNSGNPQSDTNFSYTILNRTTTSFDVRIQRWFSSTTNISFDWFVLSY